MKKILLAAICFSVLNVNAGQKPDLKKFFGAKSIKELPANVKILSEQEKDGIRLTSMKFDGDKNYIAKGIPGTAGRKFLLKGWFKSADPARGGARLQINWSGSKPFKYNLKTPKITGEYQMLKLEGTIPPGAKSGLLIITSPGKGMFVDYLEYYVTD